MSPQTQPKPTPTFPPTPHSPIPLRSICFRVSLSRSNRTPFTATIKSKNACKPALLAGEFSCTCFHMNMEVVLVTPVWNLYFVHATHPQYVVALGTTAGNVNTVRISHFLQFHGFNLRGRENCDT